MMVQVMASPFSTGMLSYESKPEVITRNIVHVAGTPGSGKSTIKKTVENMLTESEAKKVKCIELDEFTCSQIWPRFDLFKDDASRQIYYVEEMNKYFRKIADDNKDAEVVLVVGLSGWMYPSGQQNFWWDHGATSRFIASTARYNLYLPGTKTTRMYIDLPEDELVKQAAAREVTQKMGRDKDMVLKGFTEIHFDANNYKDLYQVFKREYTVIGDYKLVSQDDALAFVQNLIRPSEFGKPAFIMTDDEKKEQQTSRKRKLGELEDGDLAAEPLRKKLKHIQDQQAKYDRDLKVVQEAQAIVEAKNASGNWNATIELKGNVFDKMRKTIAAIDKKHWLEDEAILNGKPALVSDYHLTIASNTGYPDFGLEHKLVAEQGGSVSIVPTSLYVSGGSTIDKDSVDHEFDMIRVKLDDSLGKFAQLQKRLCGYMGIPTYRTDPYITLAYLKKGQGSAFVKEHGSSFGVTTMLSLSMEYVLYDKFPVMVTDITFTNATTKETTVIKIANPTEVSSSPAYCIGFSCAGCDSPDCRGRSWGFSPWWYDDDSF